MGVRIDTTTEGDEIVVYVAGRLGGNEVTELRNECEPIEGTFVLDLSKVLFADDAGIDLIRALRAKGATVRGASAFIQMLLADRERTDDG